MKLNSQLRIMVTSTDVKKIDLEIKKLKLLLEGKTLTKVTVFVKKKKQKFYTVLKSPQKYKRAKNTYCSYIYEAMLSTRMDLNSNPNLVLLSQLKDFYAQNTNIGFKIVTKVVKITETNKSLKLSTKLQNRFLKNKKRNESNSENKKLDKISTETPREHINSFVNKFIKYIKFSERKKLKSHVINACILDHLNKKLKQESKGKIIISQKLVRLKRKIKLLNKKVKNFKKTNNTFHKKKDKSHYRGKNKPGILSDNKIESKETKKVNNFDNKTKKDKAVKSKTK